MTEYLSLWDSSSFIETSTIEDCYEILKEVEGYCVFIFIHSYHHPMIQIMKISCASFNHCLYLHKTDELLSNPYNLDSGTAVAPTCHYNPVVIYEDYTSKVSTSNEVNNNKHVIKIDNENNEPPTQLRKLNKNT